MPLTTVSPGLLDSTAQYTGFKNRIINGAMVIDQRNGGASVSPAAPQYTLDRWQAYMNAASAKYSVQQNAGSVTPPPGFSNYLGATSLGAYTVAAGEIMAFQHVIEGFNIADFAWGTANAQPITLSFWVRSSLTGTFGGSIRQGTGARSYPFTYSINSLNTWEQKTITIPGDTSGTYATNNTAGILLSFGIGVGSTFSSSAGSWQSGNFVSATGTVSVVGTNAATWYITGVQLEKGTAATSFDYRPYGTELALCQRYFFKTYDTNTAPATVTNSGALGSITNASGYMVVPVIFPVCMRAGPTVTFYNATSGASGTWRDGGGVSLTMGAGSTGTSSFYAYNYTASANSTAAGHLIASAEL